MTKIDIVSGFLGAGKTTLIKKLLDESFKGEKIVLIENEFGEIKEEACQLFPNLEVTLHTFLLLVSCVLELAHILTDSPATSSPSWYMSKRGTLLILLPL